MSDSAMRRPAPADRPGTRLGIGLVWAVLMLMILGAATFGGLLAGAWLGFRVLPHFDGGHDVQWLLLIGAIAGVAAGLTIGHRGRGWVQAWRLRRIRRGGGVTVAATVRCFSSRYVRNPRGGGVTIFQVRVGWLDHQGGEQLGERQYKFYGRGEPAFVQLVQHGAHVQISYPTGRPGRFIVDIPYAPTMADQFI
jgi:hypothetical protein